MFDDGTFQADLASASLMHGPPTQEEIELIAALGAQELAALNAEGDAWWDADDGPDEVDWDALERRRDPTADELASHPTGPTLAFALDDVDPTRLDDYTAVELVAAWYRLTAWAQAGAARAAAELAQRESMVLRESPPVSAPRRRRRPSLSGAAAHELAMRLTISRKAAQSVIDVGIAIDSVLMPVGDALSEGLIDLPKARAFVEGLAGAPLPVAFEVQDAVLPGAPSRTVRQVSADIAKALVSTDPVEASRRHRAARDRRRVCNPTPLPDGMAGIWSVLPAPDAVALDVALEAAARTAVNGGDSRTVDQVRADVLAGIGHAALADGWIGIAGSAEIGVGVDDDAGPAESKEPGAEGSANPAGSPEPSAHSSANPAGSPEPGADRSASSAESTACGANNGANAAPFTEPSSDNGSSPAEAPEPGADIGANPAGSPEPGAGTDGVENCEPAEGDATPAASDADDEAGRRNQAPPQRPPAGRPRHRRFRLGHIGGRPAQIRVTVPLAVLLPPTAEGEPRGGAVAELDGYGPITPDVARAIALGGTWKRLVTDPDSGAVRDVGRTRYKPPPELAELVRARDGTCVRPGCGARAQGCDLDHTTPFHLGGHTADWNLGALCPTDHALKTAGGFQVEQVRPGVFDFAMPSGHVYRREPDGSTRLIHQERDDGPPPF